MSEKSAPPAACAPDSRKKACAMSSPRALLMLAAFLALPFGFVYFMSHCNHLAPSTSPLTPYPSGYRHPHATTQAKQSILGNIAKLMAEASPESSMPHMQMRFCAGEDLRDCKAYEYNRDCTKVDDQRVLSLAEPRMFHKDFSACTVYRRGVQDCSMDDENSFKHVKEFVVNWHMSNEDDKYASNGVVPLLPKEWISDIGSFNCR